MSPSVHEEYAALMKPNGSGYYLYRPQPFRECHPGAVGCFDQNGIFYQITDLSEPGRPEKDGFGRFGPTLIRAPSKTSTWETTSSGSEAEHSFGLEAGVSGALSAAPIDVSAEAKNKWGKTGKAALITKNIIVEDSFAQLPRATIGDWIKANAKAIVQSQYREEIAEYGLWVISRTWSTDECQIKMESAHSRDTSGGLNVGATGIAKGGASASTSMKSNSEGWATYTASETDQSLVVSYGGTGYRVATFTKMFRGGPLKYTGTRTSATNEFIKPLYNADGEQTGVEYYRAVFDENGQQIGEEKIDKDAERKAAEEEQKQLNETTPEVEVEFDTGLSIGEPEEHEEQEKKREQEAEFKRKVGEIEKMEDEEEKKAALAKLLDESAKTTTTTMTI